jgi:ferritin-like metal-binding protein YciE
MALMDVLIDELRDLYSAENQLVKALPKLAKGAKNKELKSAFKDHLEETKGQVLRLREVFGHLGKKPTGKHCEGMEGVVKEGTEALEEDAEGATFDSGLIGAALRTEHYEIAGYTAAIAMAKALGKKDAVSLLQATLNEVAAGKKILMLGKTILKEAVSEPEEDESKPKSAKEKTSEKKSKEDEKKAAPSVKKGAAPKPPAPPADEESTEPLAL